MTLTLDSTIKLASGNLIPRLGYGVYQARGSECEDGVKEAIRVGYRHIDSAQAYRNEDREFGQAHHSSRRDTILLQVVRLPRSPPTTGLRMCRIRRSY